MTTAARIVLFCLLMIAANTIWPSGHEGCATDTECGCIDDCLGDTTP